MINPELSHTEILADVIELGDASELTLGWAGVEIEWTGGLYQS